MTNEEAIKILTIWRETNAENTENPILNDQGKDIARVTVEAIGMAIEALKEVQKQGVWLVHKGYHADAYRCSSCGWLKANEDEWYYCPHCGAKMKGETDGTHFTVCN